MKFSLVNASSRNPYMPFFVYFFKFEMITTIMEPNLSLRVCTSSLHSSTNSRNCPEDSWRRELGLWN